MPKGEMGSSREEVKGRGETKSGIERLYQEMRREEGGELKAGEPENGGAEPRRSMAAWEWCRGR
jgi:hypothetical protein